MLGIEQGDRGMCAVMLLGAQSCIHGIETWQVTKCTVPKYRTFQPATSTTSFLAPARHFTTTPLHAHNIPSPYCPSPLTPPLPSPSPSPSLPSCPKAFVRSSNERPEDELMQLLGSFHSARAAGKELTPPDLLDVPGSSGGAGALSGGGGASSAGAYGEAWVAHCALELLLSVVGALESLTDGVVRGGVERGEGRGNGGPMGAAGELEPPDTPGGWLGGAGCGRGALVGGWHDCGIAFPGCHCIHTHTSQAACIPPPSPSSSLCRHTRRRQSSLHTLGSLPLPNIEQKPHLPLQSARMPVSSRQTRWPPWLTSCGGPCWRG